MEANRPNRGERLRLAPHGRRLASRHSRTTASTTAADTTHQSQPNATMATNTPPTKVTTTDSAFIAVTDSTTKTTRSHNNIRKHSATKTTTGATKTRMKQQTLSKCMTLSQEEAQQATTHGQRINKANPYRQQEKIPLKERPRSYYDSKGGERKDPANIRTATDNTATGILHHETTMATTTKTTSYQRPRIEDATAQAIPPQKEKTTHAPSIAATKAATNDPNWPLRPHASHPFDSHEQSQHTKESTSSTTKKTPSPHRQPSPHEGNAATAEDTEIMRDQEIINTIQILSNRLTSIEITHRDIANHDIQAQIEILLYFLIPIAREEYSRDVSELTANWRWHPIPSLLLWLNDPAARREAMNDIYYGRKIVDREKDDIVPAKLPIKPTQLTTAVTSIHLIRRYSIQLLSEFINRAYRPVSPKLINIISGLNNDEIHSLTSTPNAITALAQKHGIDAEFCPPLLIDPDQVDDYLHNNTEGREINTQEYEIEPEDGELAHPLTDIHLPPNFESLSSIQKRQEIRNPLRVHLYTHYGRPAGAIHKHLMDYEVNDLVDLITTPYALIQEVDNLLEGTRLGHSIPSNTLNTAVFPSPAVETIRHNIGALKARQTDKHNSSVAHNGTAQYDTTHPSRKSHETSNQRANKMPTATTVGTITSPNTATTNNNINTDNRSPPESYYGAFSDSFTPPPTDVSRQRRVSFGNTPDRALTPENIPPLTNDNSLPQPNVTTTASTTQGWTTTTGSKRNTTTDSKRIKRYGFSRHATNDEYTQEILLSQSVRNGRNNPAETLSYFIEDLTSKFHKLHHSARIRTWDDNRSMPEPTTFRNTKNDQSFMENYYHHYNYDPIKNRMSFKIKLVSSMDYLEFRSTEDPELKKMKWMHFNFLRNQDIWANGTSSCLYDYQPIAIIPFTGIHDNANRIKFDDIDRLERDQGRQIDPDSVQYIHRRIETPHCYKNQIAVQAVVIHARLGLQNPLWETLSLIHPNEDYREIYPASYDYERLDAREEALQHETEYTNTLNQQRRPMQSRLFIQMRNWNPIYDVHKFRPTTHLNSKNIKTIETLIMGTGPAYQEGDIDMPSPFQKVLTGNDPTTIYLVANKDNAHTARVYAKYHLPMLLAQWLPGEDVTPITIYHEPMRDRFSKFRVGQSLTAQYRNSRLPSTPHHNNINQSRIYGPTQNQQQQQPSSPQTKYTTRMQTSQTNAWQPNDNNQHTTRPTHHTDNETLPSAPSPNNITTDNNEQQSQLYTHQQQPTNLPEPPHPSPPNNNITNSENPPPVQIIRQRTESTEDSPEVISNFSSISSNTESIVRILNDMMQYEKDRQDERAREHAKQARKNDIIAITTYGIMTALKEMTVILESLRTKDLSQDTETTSLSPRNLETDLNDPGSAVKRIHKLAAMFEQQFDNLNSDDIDNTTPAEQEPNNRKKHNGSVGDTVTTSATTAPSNIEWEQAPTTRGIGRNTIALAQIQRRHAQQVDQMVLSAEQQQCMANKLQVQFETPTTPRWQSDTHREWAAIRQHLSPPNIAWHQRQTDSNQGDSSNSDQELSDIHNRNHRQPTHTTEDTQHSHHTRPGTQEWPIPVNDNTESDNTPSNPTSSEHYSPSPPIQFNPWETVQSEQADTNNISRNDPAESASDTSMDDLPELVHQPLPVPVLRPYLIPRRPLTRSHSTRPTRHPQDDISSASSSIPPESGLTTQAVIIPPRDGNRILPTRQHINATLVHLAETFNSNTSDSDYIDELPIRQHNTPSDGSISLPLPFSATYSGDLEFTPTTSDNSSSSSSSSSSRSRPILVIIMPGLIILGLDILADQLHLVEVVHTVQAVRDIGLGEDDVVRQSCLVAPQHGPSVGHIGHGVHPEQLRVRLSHMRSATGLQRPLQKLFRIGAVLDLVSARSVESVTDAELAQDQIVSDHWTIGCSLATGCSFRQHLVQSQIA